MAVTNKRGIFSLLDVRERQGAGTWSTRSDVFLSPSPFSKPFTFGYFGGGLATTPSTNFHSNIDRVDYSNDTETASPKGELSETRGYLAATGNRDFGYFGGGKGNPAASIKSLVDRVDYSNDTATAAVKGSLSLDKFGVAATGNKSFGYFGGGNSSPPISSVDRVDYSNDTATAVEKGPLSAAKYFMGATGNSDFGYFGGGYNSPGSPVYSYSTIDRIDYSNDTAAATPKGPFPATRTSLGATGNADFGYFAGGYSKSTVDRVDYSNDTATAVEKGPLTQGRAVVAATGNLNFGYFAGGDLDPGAVSTVDRIDFSNDTPAASPKGPLSTIRRNLGASSGAGNALP